MVFPQSRCIPAAVLATLLLVSGNSAGAQEPSPTQYALESAVLHAESVNEPVRNRLSAIRTLQAFASGFPLPEVHDTLPVIDAEQTVTARHVLEALMNDPHPTVAEQALLSLSYALRFERDTAGLAVLMAGNRDRAEVWIHCLPHIVRSENHNAWTRRRAAEKLAETAGVLRQFYDHDRAQTAVDRELATKNLKWTVVQMRMLIGELSVITEQLIYERPGRIPPDYAVVCENLLNALVSDVPFSPAGSISQTQVPSPKTPASDRTQQPIAATSLRSAGSSLQTAAAEDNVASDLQGVSETGTFDTAVHPGLRVTVPAGKMPPVPQSQRMGRRIPGITLESTSDSSRHARSRGAVGAAQAGGARMVAPPPDAVPATRPR